MKKNRYFSITKFGEHVNEDSVLVKENLIAVSDGAGGGGVFADEWSRYLLENLPGEPFSGYEVFDSWVNVISDAFYNEHEIIAKQKGGLFLEKFYDEGAFATLAAIWRLSSTEYAWVTYGDSVAFAYDPVNNILEHSFSHLVDFNQPPHLISLISSLEKGGYRTGRFSTSTGSFVFVASDALAHYILASFDSAKGLQEELRLAIEAKSRNSTYIKALLLHSRKDFCEEVIRKFSNNASNRVNSTRILVKLYKDGLIGLDDYSIAFMPD